MATYKIRVDFSSKNGWFVARLGDNAIWVLPQDSDQKFTIDSGTSDGVTARFHFNISEKSKCIDGSIQAFNPENFGAARATMDIYVETNEDKIELSLGDIEGFLHFKSDVDHLEFDNVADRLITLRLK